MNKKDFFILLLKFYFVVVLLVAIYTYFTYDCTGWFCYDTGLGLFLVSLLNGLLWPLKLYLLFFPFGYVGL